MACPAEYAGAPIPALSRVCRLYTSGESPNSPESDVNKRRSNAAADARFRLDFAGDDLRASELFVSKRRYRIDSHRPASGKIAGEQGYHR
jgi:hypothetical protein